MKRVVSGPQLNLAIILGSVTVLVTLLVAEVVTMLVAGVFTVLVAMLRAKNTISGECCKQVKESGWAADVM
jgi:hypothetical protein